MHRFTSTSSLARMPALASAMLLVGCFNPEGPELTASPTTTGEGSTSTPPLDTTDSTTSEPGETTVAVEDTSSGPVDPSTSGEDTTTNATTEATTGTPACGNGAVDDGEDCDDAGESAACDDDCTFAECGDMVINASALEACDDGNAQDDDGCVACQPASCGDGLLYAGVEACDDGNLTDLDACSNACTAGTIQVSGNAFTYVVNALDAMGETFANDPVEWPAPGVAGVMIIAHDGASVTAPNYQTHLDAGGHLLMVGGSGDPAYAAWASTYLANTGEGLWHQSSTCVSDWNTAGAHPITALMPPTHEFMDQSVSYHMLHFTAGGQPPETVLLGQSCEAGPNNYVLATRRYPSGGTFTYMALDIGPYTDGTSQAAFVIPFLQGYLGYLRSPMP